MSSCIVALFVLLLSPLGAVGDGHPSPAESAQRVLDAYHTGDANPAKKKLHIVCWRTREREFPADYHARLRRILENIRDFYAGEMARNGFGRLTFELDYDAAGELVIHEAVGTGTYDDYPKKTGGEPIRKDCWRVLRAAGLDPDRETVVIFTNLGKWDPDARTFSHHSPYQGRGDFRGGIAWQVDHPALDVKNLTSKEPLMQDGEYGRISLGKHNSIFIGGIAHELGHALGLPHCRESTEEARTRGTTLMGSGNRTYGDELRGEGKGSFLDLASAIRLASHPLFTGFAKGANLPAEARFAGLSVAAAPGEITVTGSVTGAAPVYAVIAYLDPEGTQDYDARTAVAVPNADGTFVLHCRELVAGRPAVLRLVACMANGATDHIQTAYQVARDGTPDVTAMTISFELAPFLSALATNVQQAAGIRDSLPASSRARQIATAIVAGRSGKRPAVSAVETKSLPLSSIAPTQASVGWWRPTYDSLPGVDPLLIVGGEIFDTGIFAHAPASYRYDLTGGGWKRLTGKCGLPLQQPNSEGSVIFVIRADGKEVLRTAKFNSSRTQTFDIDLTGVRDLELITEDAGDGITNDWGLWLGAQLTR